MRKVHVQTTDGTIQTYTSAEPEVYEHILVIKQTGPGWMYQHNLASYPLTSVRKWWTED